MQTIESGKDSGQCFSLNHKILGVLYFQLMLHPLIFHGGKVSIFQVNQSYFTINKKPNKSQ